VKITGIQLKNFLIFKELKLGGDDAPLSPHMNLLMGKNKKGKTDVLKSIPAGLFGNLDPSMIRTGEEKSEIIIDLEAYKIRRTITQKGTKDLKVTSADGSVNTTLQTYIDSLIGIADKEKRSFLFNPIALVLSDDKAKYLRDLFKTTMTPEDLKDVSEEFTDGIDYTMDGMDIINLLANEKTGLIYRKRAELNKVAGQKLALLTGKLEAIKGFDPDTYQPGAVEDLSRQIGVLRQEISNAEKLQELEKKNKPLREDLEKKIASAEELLKALKGEKEIADERVTLTTEIDDIRRQISELQKKLEGKEAALKALDDTKKQRRDLEDSLKNWRETLEAIKIKDMPNVEELNTHLQAKEVEHETALAEEAKYDIWLEAEQDIRPEYEKKKAEADKLTDNLKYLRKDLAEKLTKEANIPIDNLRIEDNTVWVGDISVDNMSTSEQMMMGLDMTKRLNAGAPFQVLICDRVESLDDESFAVLQQWVIENDVQLFATSVYHEGQKVPEGSLFVGDGGSVTAKKPEKAA
jgi:hypothetical protein